MPFTAASRNISLRGSAVPPQPLKATFLPPAVRLRFLGARPSRRQVLVALALLVVLVGGAIATRNFLRESDLTGASPATSHTVAVFPFVHHGGKDLDYLGWGV